MSEEKKDKSLFYSRVNSFIHPSFWNKLSELKLNVDQLKETARPIWGYYSNTSSQGVPQSVNLQSDSFNKEPGQNFVPFHGTIINKNTAEQFKDCNKNELIAKEGGKFLEKLKSGEVLQKPSLLNWFSILSFADLKKYHFYYWFAYPVPQNLPAILKGKQSITKKFNEKELLDLFAQWDQLDIHQKPYFLTEKTVSGFQVHCLKDKINEINEKNYQNFYFCFADSINQQDDLPRTHLKNYLLLISYYCKSLHDKDINILQFSREFNKERNFWDCSKSNILLVTLPKVNLDNITWVGWEKNERGGMGPRMSDMQSSMDPKRLYKESMDLNLKLMKWRLLPKLDLEKIKKTKCLLLGSGTLGCSVARTLIGWGVENITFVDNAQVSYSNPARQILFTYDDALKKLPKAEAASNSLKKISPDINTKGYQFKIPMPGHTVSKETLPEAAKSVKQLEDLIKNHDQIFTLTDSRESRWLPTMLGIYYKKTIINVALGFDSYLVMRCGGEKTLEKVESPPGYAAIAGGDLGCYFCMDVTAPGDSSSMRTLDQQCTVTRPGVSLIAGALAVELTISLIQHEKGINAPALYKQNSSSNWSDEDHGGILGILPHSIRGFLSSFSQVLPATPKFNKCVACSEKVLQAYQENGFEFLCNVFNSPSFLENVSGLTDLKKKKNFDDIVELDDFECDD